MKVVNSLTGLEIFLILVVFGCTSTGEVTKSSGSDNDNSSRIQVENSSIDLATYLRKVPGLMVQGTGDDATVLVRGSQSVNSNNQPLFVVDGSRMGRYFSRVASSVDVNDIEDIEVLKGNEASSRYGMEGSNGVVVIRTKKN